VALNDFVRRSCQPRDAGADADGACVTSASLLSRLCGKFPTRLVTSSSLPMATARKMMVANPSLQVVYLFRDPRAIVHTRSRGSKDLDMAVHSDQLCRSIQVGMLLSVRHTTQILSDNMTPDQTLLNDLQM
jgi:hypothetical protein